MKKKLVWRQAGAGMVADLKPDYKGEINCLKRKMVKPKNGQHWVEKKTGKLVFIVEGEQNGLVRFDTLESVTDGVPKFSGYWAEKVGNWSKRFKRV